MDFSDAVIYQIPDGPVFVLPNQEMKDYFASCDGGLPEAPLINWARTAFRPSHGSGTFFDIGAHVGTWSLSFAHSNWDVVTFEPQVTLTRLMQGAQALSHARRIDLYRWAIGDKNGRITLQAPFADGGGASTVCTWDAPALTATVQVCPLDSLFATSSYPRMIDLVKIDVEGAELDVLKGGYKTFMRYAPPIIFECWNDERGQRKEELFRYLNDVMLYDVQAISWPETYLATPR